MITATDYALLTALLAMLEANKYSTEQQDRALRRVLESASVEDDQS